MKSFGRRFRDWASSGSKSSQIFYFFIMTLVFPMLLMGFALAVLSPVMLFFVVKDWSEVRGTYLIETTAYRTTKGTVLETSTYETVAKTGPETHYRILYEYNIQDTKFQSTQVTFTRTGSSDESFALRYLEKYPVGKKIDVYYLPDEPNFSVLEPTQSGNFLLEFLSIALGLLAGSFYLFNKITNRISHDRKTHPRR
jgi:hypothetical protein